MKKIETPNIFIATYDPKNPYDIAQSIWDDLVTHENRDAYLVLRIIEKMDWYSGLNDFGKKVLQAIRFKIWGTATNKGVPQELIDDYTDFFIWQRNHKQDTKKTEEFLQKMYANNPDRDFKKLTDFLDKKGENKLLEGDTK